MLLAMKDEIMKVTALLTGRGNNSLKDKNLLDILGKPVLYYPASAGRCAQTINNWYCSSDDARILAVAEELGYSPIIRPPEFATPSSQHIECIHHALGVLKEAPDILVVILANNITIKAEWIDACVTAMLNDYSVTAVVPVYQDNDHHPLRAKGLTEEGTLKPYINTPDFPVSSNRQDLPKSYFLSHNFWVLNGEFLRSGKQGQPPWTFMGDKILPYETKEAIDIHDLIDLEYAARWIEANFPK